jgi:hypothetical protein
MPVSSVLTDSATRILIMICSVLAPFAASAPAIEAASTLITATAGESGPPMTGEKVEVAAITTQVTAVPMISPESPRGKPPARSPLKMSAAKEMQ